MSARNNKGKEAWQRRAPFVLDKVQRGTTKSSYCWIRGLAMSAKNNKESGSLAQASLFCSRRSSARYNEELLLLDQRISNVGEEQ